MSCCLTKKILAMVCVLAVMTCGLVSAAPEANNRDYSQILPSDTIAVVSANNLFEVINPESESPLSAILTILSGLSEEEGINQLGGMFEATVNEELEALGLTFKDLSRLLTGKFALATLMVPASKEEVDERKKELDKKAAEAGQDPAERAEPNVPMTFRSMGLVEYRGSAAEFEEIVARVRDDMKATDDKSSIIEERTEGITLYTMESIREEVAGGRPGAPDASDELNISTNMVYFTLYNGSIVVSEEKSTLMETVHSLSRGVAKNPLSGTSEFIAAKQEMGSSNDIYAMINIEALGSGLRDEMKAELFNEVLDDPTLKPFLDPETVMSALALEQLGTIFVSLGAGVEASDIRGGFTWKDKVGIATLLNFGKTPARIPAFVSEDYKGVRVVTYDISTSWDAICSLIQQASPQAWFLLNMSLNIDPSLPKVLNELKTGFLDNVQSEVVSLDGYVSATPAEDELPKSVSLIRFKDTVLLKSSIDNIFSILNEDKDAGAGAVEFEAKEYFGVTIYTVPFGLPANGNARRSDESSKTYYAFLDEYLMISDEIRMIEGVIANMKNPGKPIATKQLNDTFGQLPGTECDLLYADVETMVKAAINEALIRNDESKALLDARQACKNLEPYILLGKTAYTANGVFFRGVLTEEDK